jgi:hypothetical protein
VFNLSVNVNQKLCTVGARETDTVAALINRCGEYFQHYFASNSLRILRDGIDLATLDHQAILANVDINETTELHAEADTSSNSNSSLLQFHVKTLYGKLIPITIAYKHW